MSDKHILEQLRENFFTNLGELDLNSDAHNDVIAKLDRSINQVLMGVNSVPAKPAGLTRGQKAARTRALNKRKKAAEEKADNEG